MALHNPLPAPVRGNPLDLPEQSRAASLAELAEAIGHHFTHPKLLAEAVTHPNVPGLARGSRGYQRLEWLGDRVLGLVIADLLWRRFPSEPEGHLTSRHSSLVRAAALARVAANLDLGRYLIISPGEALAGTAAKPGILADVCEAIIAAVYLDGGFAAALGVVERLWEPLFDEMTAPPRSAKTRLQEWAQSRGLGLPEYELIETSGPDHALRFTMAARVAGHEPATAIASSKQQAQEKAAERLLETVADTARQPKRRRRK
jgi:ribonuclease III